MTYRMLKQESVSETWAQNATRRRIIVTMRTRKLKDEQGCEFHERRQSIRINNVVLIPPSIPNII